MLLFIHNVNKEPTKAINKAINAINLRIEVESILISYIINYIEWIESVSFITQHFSLRDAYEFIYFT